MTKLKSLDELKKMRKPLVSANEKVEQSLTKIDKLALWITDHVGSMGFFVVIFIWTVVWLGWNLFAPVSMQFDPEPGFVIWLFISNMIQIFLMPLIMIGQNVQSRQAYLHAEHDLEINIKAEQEIEVILGHLEYQNKVMLRILKKIDKKQSKSKK